MIPIEHVDHIIGVPIFHAERLAAGTLGLGVGGLALAMATESPTVTWGMVALAIVSMTALWIRSYYAYLQAQLKFDTRLRHVDALTKEVAELRIWKESATCLRLDCPERRPVGGNTLPGGQSPHDKPSG